MAITLTGWGFHVIRIPYPEPVQWADHVEAALDALILRLETAEGLTGTGETPVRAFWAGFTAGDLAKVLDAEVLPRLKAVDLADEAAVAAALAPSAARPHCNSLVDLAIWDLKAQAAGLPLWRALGGRDPNPPLSTTITRADPKEMAETAASLIEAHGFGALKIKTGQGLERDNAALAALRAAVDPGTRFFVDFNFHLDPALQKEAATMLVSHRVELVEDPVTLHPDERFAAVKETFPMPILVDAACQVRADAERFLKAGAEAVSVKMAKSGLTEGLAIGAIAEKARAKACVGISANSPIGAIASVALAGALPEVTQDIPCEESFFPRFAADYMKEPLRIVGGRLALPDARALGDLVDWKKVEALAP